MRKTILIPGIVAVVLTGAIVLGTVSVSAQETNGQTTLVQSIAKKFGLAENEVQAVFDEHKEAHHAQMQTRLEERLNQAVTDGKLTEAQKQAIIDKHNELQKNVAANKDVLQEMSPEERRETMQKHHEELKAWAEQEGIDLSLFPMVIKGGHGMKMRMWAGK